MDNNSLTKLSNAALVLQLKGLAFRERQLTAEILRYLGEVQSRSLFLELGYSSLFAFCVRHLGFTEGETQRRISAMRVIKEIPAIEEEVRQGTLSLSAVAQVASFCSREEKNLEEKKELLEQVSGKTTRECEKILLGASEKPEPRPVNKITQVSLKQAKLTVTITPEVLEQLKKLKNLLSHKNPKMSYGELLAELASIALKKLDPAQKPTKGGAQKSTPEAQLKAGAKVKGPSGKGAGLVSTTANADHALAHLAQQVIFAEPEFETLDGPKKLGKTQGWAGTERPDEPRDRNEAQIHTSGPGEEPGRGYSIAAKQELPLARKVKSTEAAAENRRLIPAKRQHIPAAIRRQVWQRDQGRCSFISPAGIRCESRFRLEIDHCRPVSLGGLNAPANMRLLCRNHNMHMAVKVLGANVMGRFMGKGG